MKFGDIHEINSVLQQIQNEEKTKVVESCGCGCGTQEECTCGPECSNCECHNESVEEVAQKNYNDYKGIQLHNLEKQLNQVFKTLLALTDIEDKDNSSDMANDLRNMHGALSDLKDAHNNAFEKLNTGRHRKESTNEVAEHGTTEYYRELDKGQLNHTKSMLMKTAGQLNVAIEQRYKFSKELMGGTGDRAGTGDLQKMLDTLNNIIGEWDEETKLYGK